MKTYKNKSGGSGIKGYENLSDGIRVEFTDGSLYLYNYATNGQRKIEDMKALAENGIGLTTYINKNIRDNFAEKIR
ncbi:MAG TPA: hypothetical protein VGB50_07410 [Flavobacterium sp.]|jgi:hypothetical protein